VELTRSQDIGLERLEVKLKREKIENRILNTRLGLLREELKFVKKENNSE
jgi:hypothetical protein